MRRITQLCFTILVLAVLPGSVFSQSNYWTWTKGSNTVNSNGTYGTQGIASASNNPGGRYGTVTWLDHSGNLWLFGGIGYASVGSSSYLNDLWKFDRSTNQWTWMKGSNTSGVIYGVYGTKGVSSPANTPGSRYSKTTWVDASGCFWLFGGRGHGETGAANLLNDLWKFDPATNEWAWISGSKVTLQTGSYGSKGIASSLNHPGARYPGDAWIDAAGDLYMFGGEGYASAGYGMLNDMWKYNIATNQWTWTKGSNGANPSPNYGVKGVSNSINTPDGRYGTASWKDASGNFWMFGGYTNGVRFNDLWKYNPSSNEWVWMHGDNSPNTTGNIGTVGTASPSNMPGAKEGSSAWKDADGNFWLFGGYFNYNVYNDFWKYDPSTNQWTCLKTGGIPSYGSQEVSSASSYPGARGLGISWGDQNGNFWMFGGGPEALDKNFSAGNLNDLWRYGKPSPVKFLVTGGGQSCANGSGVAINLSGSEAGVSYQLLLNGNNTGSPLIGTGSGLNFPNQSAPGTYSVKASNAWSVSSMIGNASVSIIQPPHIAVTQSTTVLCNGGSATINVTATGGTAPYTGTGIFQQNAGNQLYTITDQNGCTASQTITITEPAVLLGGSTSMSPNPVLPHQQFNTIYNGFGPQTVTINTTGIAGGTGAYNFVWTASVNNSSIQSGQGTGTIQVSPTVTTTYILTVTDANGCILMPKPTFTVEVINSQSTTHPNKNYICHNGNTLEVNNNSVMTHINHGDPLGPCQNLRGIAPILVENEQVELIVSPNPSVNDFSIRMESNIQDEIVLRIFDLSGKVILSKNKLAPGQVVKIGSDFPAGYYLVEMKQGVTTKTIKLIKQ